MADTKYISQYRARRAARKIVNIHPADRLHYDKRLAEYDRLQEERDKLDGRTQSSQISAMTYKIQCIEREFEQLAQKHALAQEKE